MCVKLTEQDQYDVREDVTSTETLLQTEHHQERTGTKTSVPVSEPTKPFRKTSVQLQELMGGVSVEQVHENS